ncbi:hypothetical protein LguiA_007588 [Lonicera macranthoides]
MQDPMRRKRSHRVEPPEGPSGDLVDPDNSLANDCDEPMPEFGFISSGKGEIMDIEKTNEQEQLHPRNRKGLQPIPRSDPLLLYIHDKRGIKHTFYRISDGQELVRNIHCMRRKVVCASSYGWLCLRNNSSGSSCLLNSTSWEKIELPTLILSNYIVCLLSSPPANPGCTVVFICNSAREGFVTFKIYRPNIDGAIDSWIEQEVNLGGYEIEHAVNYDGRIYGIDYRSGHVFIFEVSNITASITVRKIEMQEETPLPLLAEVDKTKKILVESCGELYVVRLILWDELDPLVIQDLEVFKLEYSSTNFNLKVWERVESIGDRAFFLSSNCSASCSAKEKGIEGNTIYISMQKDRSLYAFNLRDKSITISLPCPNVKLNWSQPSWVLL